MQLTLQQQFLRQPRVISYKQQLIAVTRRTVSQKKQMQKSRQKILFTPTTVSELHPYNCMQIGEHQHRQGGSLIIAVTRTISTEADAKLQNENRTHPSHSF